jgi:hypothetical protein
MIPALSRELARAIADARLRAADDRRRAIRRPRADSPAGQRALVEASLLRPQRRAKPSDGDRA